MWQEGAVNHLGFDGQTLSHSEALLRTLSENEEVQGCYDLDVRYEQMTAEGVQKSINFPQLVILFARYPDLEVRPDEHTSEHPVTTAHIECRLLSEKKKENKQ